MSDSELLTVAQETLRYEPDTGRLYRVAMYGHAIEPVLIKAKTAGGYLELMVAGKIRLAHRIIWLMQTGSSPNGKIDHRNGIRDDNRWVNLRDVSDCENAQNLTKPHADNRSGFLGVERRKTGRFNASIMVNGVRHRVGNYATPEEAHAKYVELKRDLHIQNELTDW